MPRRSRVQLVHLPQVQRMICSAISTHTLWSGRAICRVQWRLRRTISQRDGHRCATSLCACAPQSPIAWGMCVRRSSTAVPTRRSRRIPLSTAPFCWRRTRRLWMRRNSFAHIRATRVSLTACRAIPTMRLMHMRKFASAISRRTFAAMYCSISFSRSSWAMTAHALRSMPTVRRRRRMR